MDTLERVNSLYADREKDAFSIFMEGRHLMKADDTQKLRGRDKDLFEQVVVLAEIFLEEISFKRKASGNEVELRMFTSQLYKVAIVSHDSSYSLPDYFISLNELFRVWVQACDRFAMRVVFDVEHYRSVKDVCSVKKMHEIFDDICATQSGVFSINLDLLVPITPTLIDKYTKKSNQTEGTKYDPKH